MNDVSQLYKPRPMLTSTEQVAFLKNKGVRFALISEKEAADFLNNNNFFFKIKAFCKNFDKYSSDSHPQSGHYINLDFAYLVELSKLDMYLRTFILQASLDVEHCLKVRLNKDFMLRGLDGYSQVSAFFNYTEQRIVEEQLRSFKENLYTPLLRSLNSTVATLSSELQNPEGCNAPKVMEAANNLHEISLAFTQGKDLRYLENSISRMGTSTYSRKLVKKYGEKECMALWNYLEMVSFGDCISFYKFYFLDYLKDAEPTDESEIALYVKTLLFPIKTLRNAAAHNDCLLNGIREHLERPIGSISKTLQNDYGLDGDLLSNTKRIPVLHDFSALLICYNKIVTSQGIRNARSSDLGELQKRFQKNSHYFNKQNEIEAAFALLDSLFQSFSEELLRSLS